MTIGRRLYQGFGAILGIMAILLLFNIFTVLRQYSTRSAANSATAEVKAIDEVRYQVMQNRLSLGSYLLSGDARDEDKTNKGITDVQQLLKDAETKAKDAGGSLQSTLSQVEDNENGWADNFAKPMIAKRHQVDSGNTTVSDLQVYYLQHDPYSWTNKSASLLDTATQAVEKDQADTSDSSTSATTWNAVVTISGTILAALIGAFIAFRTAKSITEPLKHLIEVAHRIGESGDLDQSIDIRRDDEVGILAANFNKMIVHLREMASVSSAIAGGQLAVAVKPRSHRDTMARAFAQMTQGLRDLVRQVRDSASQVASGASQMAGASDESAKVSVQAASAIDEVTSTMHEMSVNVQNVVKNTQIQASSVSETSASIDQMVASIQRVADTAKMLVEISHRSREEAQTGRVTMDKATQGLNRTSKAIQSSANIIDVLGRRANDIGKIIEVIDDLAEQTNLLALNAAI